jgi:hypothetical protein
MPRLRSFVVFLALAGCGDDAAPTPPTETSRPPEANREQPAETQEARTEEPAALGAALPNGLLLAYAQFAVENDEVTANPGPARLEILRRTGGEWRSEVLEDDSNIVFHKAMIFAPPNAAPGILTLGGSRPCPESGARDCKAALKLWRHGANGWTSETLWEEDFGGRFNRMRDAEIADFDGDGTPEIAVATHDQGVVAIVSTGANGYSVARLDHEEDKFVHEIEIGDLDGDGRKEVYATPSEPNQLSGGEQHGVVVRYVPGTENSRTVVADLGSRHAKEIWVGDVDGDGRDELYVAVEALTTGEGANMQIAEPVEIRRYDHDTAPNAGVVIATIQDRLTRFLTVGDGDGDGKREMIAAAFRSGLWLLKPGRDPRSEWSIESLDRDSSGFEHASIFADLDGDGRDELYVAADEQGELRRYVWTNGRAQREVIHRREIPRAQMTWNIVPFRLALIEGSP